MWHWHTCREAIILKLRWVTVFSSRETILVLSKVKSKLSNHVGLPCVNQQMPSHLSLLCAVQLFSICLPTKGLLSPRQLLPFEGYNSPKPDAINRYIQSCCHKHELLIRCAAGHKPDMFRPIFTSKYWAQVSMLNPTLFGIFAVLQTARSHHKIHTLLRWR